MINFHDFNIQTLAQFFEAHPHSAGIFTYLVVFAEAMAVIGAIVPGAIIMPAIGFLIGSAVIPAGSIFMYAIAGAITGDCLSYWIGSYFKDRVHRIWPFTRWPNLINQSENFFRNHGGKSVFIGRFVGPVRAMIPMVAGMLKMPFLRFLFVALPSAVIWAVGYMIPGVLLGALSLELPKKVAIMFTLGMLLTGIGFWLVAWLVRHYLKQILRMLDYYIMQLWKYCEQHSGLCLVTKILADPEEPDNHRQLTLLVSAIFIFILFLVVLYHVATSGVCVSLNYSIYHLLSSLRSPWMYNIAILVTMFGDAEMLLIGSGIVFLWLTWKRYWYVAAHWVGIVVVTGAVLSGMKFFMYSPRPGDILFGSFTSSFPSAHVALCLSFYGFLAVIIARELQAAKRYLPYMVVGILVSMVAFTRIYLGAHWLSDILGSILLSLVILFVVTISYCRRHKFHFSGAKFALVVSGIFIVVWLGYSAVKFKYDVKAYSLIWPHQVVASNELITKIPLYRLNRLGKPIEAFNVAYVGELAAISKTLVRQGWQPQPITLDFQEVIKSFCTSSVISHLSIFPQLYHNKKIALLVTKKTGQDDVVLILRLWPSDINLTDTSSPVWIGSVEYNHAAPSVFSLDHFKGKDKREFIGATEFLAKSLTKNNDFSLEEKRYLLEQQPLEMHELHWNGKLVIIKR